MRRVERNAISEPGALHEVRTSDNTNELQRVTAYMGNPANTKAFKFSKYKDPEVKSALVKLFHGKCAYCESDYASTQPMDVEHYRPKGGVDGVNDHRGYWWLAMDWDNLLPSCIDCNRRRKQKAPSANEVRLVKLQAAGDFNHSAQISTGKSTAFPLDEGSFRATKPDHNYSAEQRLLLDPARDNPRDHLEFYVDRENLISIVYPKKLSGGQRVLPVADNSPEAVIDAALAANVSKIGAVSIQVYGLNRLDLVQARTRVLRELEFLLEMSLNLAEVVIDLKKQHSLKSVQLPASTGETKLQLEEDISFNEKISLKISRYRDETMGRLEHLMRPETPYSELARAWVSAYLAN